jgi:uroporphyrinogen III methyltransferase / synthase
MSRTTGRSTGRAEGKAAHGRTTAQQATRITKSTKSTTKTVPSNKTTKTTSSRTTRTTPKQSAKQSTSSKTVNTTMPKTTAAKTSSRAATARVDQPIAAPRPAGSVAFIGTGPGDPGLLTVRAVELIRSADVVITEAPEHPALVAEIVGERFPEVTLVDGGYGEDGQPMTHASRGKLVVKHAKGEGNVVRLISGDPWMYATGAEEANACAKARVVFEVVPGISSVTAVPAYAGVPLTTRTSREVTVLNVAENKIDWSSYTGSQTLVLLHAVKAIGDVAKALVAAGRDEQTPVAVTSIGTTTEQRTVVSTLADIGADVRAARLHEPAVTVVGDVVAMRDALSWFETKPLFGWRILVPRTKEQAGSLSTKLRTYGGVPEEVPTISVEPPRNPLQMDKAVRGLVEGRYEWIVFTSVNAVKAVREKFDEYGLDARAFSGLKVAAVGDKTAESIASWGIRADLVPSGEQSAKGLLEDWPPFDDVLDPINRVFLPRADIATETLVAGLHELGWEVDDVTAYRTVRAAPPPAPTRDAIKSGKFDAVVFTSSSTVRNLVGIAGKPHSSTVIAAIGPATAKTCEEHGLRVDVLASTPSAEILADALADFGAVRRLEMITAGETVTKPSQRRAPNRRRAT